jgi:hypothetical protein
VWTTLVPQDPWPRRNLCRVCYRLLRHVQSFELSLSLPASSGTDTMDDAVARFIGLYIYIHTHTRSIGVLVFDSRRGAGNLSLHHRVQNGSGAHPAPYPMDTRGSFTGGKAAGAWSWPLIQSSAEVKECVELYLHSPNTPSWRGVQLKHRDNFTFYIHTRQTSFRYSWNTDKEAQE